MAGANPVRTALRSYHDWIIPKRVVLGILVGSLLALLLGLVLASIGSNIGKSSLVAAGAVFAVVGGCGLIVCLCFCLYAYFILHVRDQAVQTEDMLSREVRNLEERLGEGALNPPSVLKVSDGTLPRDSKKSVSYAERVQCYTAPLKYSPTASRQSSVLAAETDGSGRGMSSQEMAERVLALRQGGTFRGGVKRTGNAEFAGTGNGDGYTGSGNRNFVRIGSSNEMPVTRGKFNGTNSMGRVSGSRSLERLTGLGDAHYAGTGTFPRTESGERPFAPAGSGNTIRTGGRDFPVGSDTGPEGLEFLRGKLTEGRSQGEFILPSGYEDVNRSAIRGDFPGNGNRNFAQTAGNAWSLPNSSASLPRRSEYPYASSAGPYDKLNDDYDNTVETMPMLSPDYYVAEPEIQLPIVRNQESEAAMPVYSSYRQHRVVSTEPKVSPTIVYDSTNSAYSRYERY